MGMEGVGKMKFTSGNGAARPRSANGRRTTAGATKDSRSPPSTQMAQVKVARIRESPAKTAMVPGRPVPADWMSKNKAMKKSWRTKTLESVHDDIDQTSKAIKGLERKRAATHDDHLQKLYTSKVSKHQRELVALEHRRHVAFVNKYRQKFNPVDKADRDDFGFDKAAGLKNALLADVSPSQAEEKQSEREKVKELNARLATLRTDTSTLRRLMDRTAVSIKLYHTPGLEEAHAEYSVALNKGSKLMDKLTKERNKVRALLKRTSLQQARTVPALRPSLPPPPPDATETQLALYDVAAGRSAKNFLDKLLGVWVKQSCSGVEPFLRARGIPAAQAKVAADVLVEAHQQLRVTASKDGSVVLKLRGAAISEKSNVIKLPRIAGKGVVSSVSDDKHDVTTTLEFDKKLELWSVVTTNGKGVTCKRVLLNPETLRVHTWVHGNKVATMFHVFRKVE